MVSVGLEMESRKRVGKFSGGMKRRLGIAQALLGDPQVLIVDEPTVGLDPEERIRFRNLLADISGDRIVLLSTHIVGDLENTCDRLAVLKRGSMIFTGQLESLIQLADGQVWQLELPRTEYESVRRELKASSLRLTEKSAVLRVVSPENPFGKGVAVEPTMEDGYLCLMGGESA